MIIEFLLCRKIYCVMYFEAEMYLMLHSVADLL